MSPWSSSATALIFGTLVALSVGNPWVEHTKKLSPKLLSYSVIGLGAGMDLIAVGKAGLHGIGLTAFSISLVLGSGLLLGRWLKTESDSSILIAVGTAICGGSAIAAVAPVINAKSNSISVALGTVFLLNSVALLIFPPLGHLMALSETQFGTWSALAIHDTSSVVGACLAYGSEALQVGTTIKLARALWIVPLTLGFAYYQRRASEPSVGTKPKPKLPWFILGFLTTAGVVTFIPALRDAGHVVELVARKGLVVTLFLIGCNLNRAALKAVGVRPLLQGLILWAAVLLTSIAAIHFA